MDKDSVVIMVEENKKPSENKDMVQKSIVTKNGTICIFEEPEE